MIFKKKFRRVFYVPGNHVPQPNCENSEFKLEQDGTGLSYLIIFIFATFRIFQTYRHRNAPKPFSTFSSLHVC